MGTLFMMVVIVDILMIIFISKDDRYFFDDEKSKLILLVIFLPVVGSIYVLTKLRDDIKWYVGMAGVVLAVTCSMGPHGWSFYSCMKILSKLGKLLS